MTHCYRRVLNKQTYKAHAGGVDWAATKGTRAKRATAEVLENIIFAREARRACAFLVALVWLESVERTSKRTNEGRAWREEKQR